MNISVKDLQPIAIEQTSFGRQAMHQCASAMLIKALNLMEVHANCMERIIQILNELIQTLKTFFQTHIELQDLVLLHADPDIRDLMEYEQADNEKEHVYFSIYHMLDIKITEFNKLAHWHMHTNVNTNDQPLMVFETSSLSTQFLSIMRYLSTIVTYIDQINDLGYVWLTMGATTTDADDTCNIGLILLRINAELRKASRIFLVLHEMHCIANLTNICYTNKSEIEKFYMDQLNCFRHNVKIMTSCLIDVCQQKKSAYVPTCDHCQSTLPADVNDFDVLKFPQCNHKFCAICVDKFNCLITEKCPLC